MKILQPRLRKIQNLKKKWLKNRYKFGNLRISEN